MQRFALVLASVSAGNAYQATAWWRFYRFWYGAHAAGEPGIGIASWLFLLVLGAVLLLITYIPDLSVALPTWLGYAELPIVPR